MPLSMKNRSFAPLGEAEMEALRHVWTFGEATVSDVHERILDDREVAYTTVMSTLAKLARKGYLDRRKEGRAFVYSPGRDPEEVRGSFLKAMIEKVFSGSPVALAQALARQEEVSEEERAEIAKLIQEIGEEDK